MSLRALNHHFILIAIHHHHFMTLHHHPFISLKANHHHFMSLKAILSSFPVIYGITIILGHWRPCIISIISCYLWLFITIILCHGRPFMIMISCHLWPLKTTIFVVPASGMAKDRDLVFYPYLCRYIHPSTLATTLVLTLLYRSVTPRPF